MLTDSTYRRSQRGRSMRRNPIEFAERHFTFDNSSTTQGKFRIKRAQFLRNVMEGFADSSVRHGTCMCSAQSGKTQTGIILASWAQAEDPGPFMWTMPAKDEAATFSTNRLTPSFEKCPPVARLMPRGRYSKKTLEINFATAPLILVGAQSGSKLSGKPIRYLFIDEEKDYKLPGAVQKAIKRTRSKWNAKVWRMSTPDRKKGTIHIAFLAGDQRHWHVKCPNCDHSEHLQWRYLRYDENEDEQAVIESIRYECPNKECDHAWRDTPEDRAYLAREIANGGGGEWVAHNLKTKRDSASWTWNALLPEWVSWGELVTEWREAQIAKRAGNLEPLKVFLNESAVEPYEEEHSSEPVTILAKDYNLVDYAKGEEIDGESFRFMTIDRQQSHWWAVIRAWRFDGSSRLLHFGKVETREGLEEVRKRFNVPTAYTFEDASHKETDVFQDCIDFGWTAIRGSKEDIAGFTHILTSGRKVKRLFSAIQKINLGKGTARLIYLCSEKLKDILAKLRGGRGAVWEIPINFGTPELTAEYHRQMNGETKREKVNTNGASSWRWVKTHDNHAWDCEYYQVAIALIYSLLGGHEEPSES